MGCTRQQLNAFFDDLLTRITEERVELQEAKSTPKPQEKANYPLIVPINGENKKSTQK
jgi:hypothetical protein